MRHRLFISIFLLCVALNGFSEDFSLITLDSVGHILLPGTVISDEAFYLRQRGFKLVRADYQTGKSEVIYDEEFVQFFGPYDNKIIIPLYIFGDEGEDMKDLIKAYDIETGEIKETADFDFMEDLFRNHYPVLEFYQNGLAFAQEFFPDNETGLGSKVSLVDLHNQRKTDLGAFGEVSHISPDKLHLLIRTELRRWYELYHIQNAISVKLANLRGPTQDYREAKFLNNEMIIVPRHSKDPTEFVLLNINDPSKQYGVDFLFEEGKTNYIIFSPDLTRGIARSYGFSFVDTTSFRDWLDENGFLFKKTTGTSNETQVRVRENPNLEAQTFGFLDLGDELEVIDRSGIKVQIGEWNEWWYKIKRKSDGLEGWAYGAFIDVAEEQGLLGADVLGLE